MIANEHHKSMHLEIDKRINSSEWDFTIASRVISRRNKKIKRNIFVISSFSLVATAAILLFAFFINTPASGVNELNRFITKQIDGTHKEVFKEVYSGSILYTTSNDNIIDPTDKLIENTLSMR